MMEILVTRATAIRGDFECPTVPYRRLFMALHLVTCILRLRTEAFHDLIHVHRRLFME
jgi:hypothetical protein